MQGSQRSCSKIILLKMFQYYDTPLSFSSLESLWNSQKYNLTA